MLVQYISICATTARILIVNYLLQHPGQVGVEELQQIFYCSLPHVGYPSNMWKKEWSSQIRWKINFFLLQIACTVNNCGPRQK